ncbi:DUF3515 domain-containing protein [Streptomyces laurentii]|jgi:hypothetical protein|uniref:Lipoprotein n=1 Tax=Streptomyces laurentii TaxID=39478 RepID=A0A160P5J9_STRLU|nr:hypothetical protein SLA_5463 [Streptomyces laurentii]
MSSHRPFGLPVRAAASVAGAVLLLTVAGCSASDSGSVAVPAPPPAEAAVCRALAKELPDTVAGLGRTGTEPESELTAAWGDGAIVLRCGVVRPEKMSDPQARAVEADGVNWMYEPREGDGPRFTTTYRKAYVEVSLDERYAHDVGPLVDLAAPVKKAVPSSL